MPRKKNPHPRKRLVHDCVFKPRDFQRPDPQAALQPSLAEQPPPPCRSDNHGGNCSVCIANAKRQYAFDILVMGMEALVAAETAKGTYRMLDNIESLLVPPEEVPCMGAEVEVSDTTELADVGVRSRAESREVIRNTLIRGNAQAVREKRAYRKRAPRPVATNTKKLAEGLPVEETIDLTNDSDDSDESEEYFWTWDDECISDAETTSSPIVVADTDNARKLAKQLSIELPIVDLTELDDAVSPAVTVNETQTSVMQYVIEENQQGEVIILPEEEVVTLLSEDGSAPTESDYIDITNEEDGHISSVIQEGAQEDASAEEAKILDVIDTDCEVIINSQIEEELLRSTDDEALESVDECPEIQFVPVASTSVWPTTAVKTEREELTGPESSQDEYVDVQYPTKSKKMKKHRKEQTETKKRKKEKKEKKREKKAKKKAKKEKKEKRERREKKAKSNKENYPETDEESEEEQIPEWATRNKPEPNKGTELRQYEYYHRATTSKMRVRTEREQMKGERRAMADLNADGIKAEPEEGQHSEKPFMFSTKRIKLDPEEVWPAWDEEMEESTKHKVKSEPERKNAPGATLHVQRRRRSSSVRIKTEQEERAASAQAGPSTNQQAENNWTEPDVEIIEDSDESCIEIDDNELKDPDWVPDEDEIEELMDYFELSD